MNGEAGVVKFKPRIERPMETNKAHKVHAKRTSFMERACDHFGVEVDRDARIVVCTKCGVTLDAIEVLWKMAIHERTIDERVEEIRKADQDRIRKLDEKKAKSAERAQERLKSWPVGSMLWVDAKRGGAFGEFRGIVDGEVALYIPRTDRVNATYKIEEVTGVRKRC